MFKLKIIKLKTKRNIFLKFGSFNIIKLQEFALLNSNFSIIMIYVSPHSYSR